MSGTIHGEKICELFLKFYQMPELSAKAGTITLADIPRNIFFRMAANKTDAAYPFPFCVPQDVIIVQTIRFLIQTVNKKSRLNCI